MPLNEGQQAQNTPVIKTIMSSTAEQNEDIPDIKIKLGSIEKILSAQLTESDVILSIDEGIAQLKGFICATVDNEEEFAEKLPRWIKVYKKLEVKATEQLQKRASQISSIRRRLASEKPSDAMMEWADEEDLRRVLQEVMKSPEDATERVEILTPVCLEVGKHAIASEKEASKNGLYEHIKTVIEKNPDKEMTLLIPANCWGGTHWCLAIIELKKNLVIEAELWDPKARFPDKVGFTEAFANMQRAVNRVNGHSASQVLVLATAAAIQKDGHACAEFVTQKALQYLHGRRLSRELQFIRSSDENDIERRREASITLIINNTPELLPRKAALLAALRPAAAPRASVTSNISVPLSGPRLFDNKEKRPDPQDNKKDKRKTKKTSRLKTTLSSLGRYLAPGVSSLMM